MRRYAETSTHRLYLVVGALFILFATGFAQTERWVYQYDGGVNESDAAKAIIEGADSNIYAVGYGRLSGTGSDAVVVSLTPSGTERWVYTYNGPGDSTDMAMDITCDESGNLYVAGCSYGVTNDAIVISLTPTGTERWVYRYDGTGNGADIAHSITVGLDGNVYAAGVSYGAATADDWLIISLDTASTERWIYRYNWSGGSDGAYALVYGPDHNIYAAGYSYHFIPYIVYTVVSVDSAGSERWIYHTSGTGVVDEAAYSIIYGPDNNIYSAGMSFLLDFTVLDLDTAGTLMWDFIHGAPGVYDRANAVTYNNGRIYAGGYFSTSSNGYDLALVCLAENGDTSWIYRFNGTGNDNDAAQDLVCDQDCCIYTCGWCTDTVGQENLLAVRLDTSGVEKWIYTYNGSASDVDNAASVVYGSDNNIYIAGCSTDSLSNLDFLVISLDTSTIGIVEEKQHVVPDNEVLFPTYTTHPFQLLGDKCYRIFDITGRLIPTLDPAPGVYFIEVNGHIRQKIIKIR